MNGPIIAPRTDRGALASRPASGASPSASDDDSTHDRSVIAAQHAAFDFDIAERAELLREHQALTALVLEQLKNEDEIMKKWIALI